MDDLDDFEAVFGDNSNIAYEKSAADAIKKKRHSLENELFIDRLLKALGIREGKKRPLLNNSVWLNIWRVQFRNHIQRSRTKTSGIFTNKSSAAHLPTTTSTPRCTIFSRTFRSTIISRPEILPMHRICLESTGLLLMGYGTWID